MALDHLQFSKPFLKYKYWHWLCYLNTSFTKVAVRSNFSLLQLITAFPFICPFGVVWCWELSLSFLCLLPQESSDVTHLPDDLVWKCILFEWPFQMWACDSVCSVWWSTLHFVFAQLTWTAFLANTRRQLPPSQRLLLCSYDISLRQVWAKEPHTCQQSWQSMHAPTYSTPRKCIYCYLSFCWFLFHLSLLQQSSVKSLIMWGKGVLQCFPSNSLRERKFPAIPWDF